MEDIPELAAHVLKRVATGLSRPVPEIALDAVRKLVAYSWPGNVGKLENALTKTLIMTDKPPVNAEAIDLPRTARPSATPRSHECFEATERQRILEALEANPWNASKVAQLLGIPRPTFYRKLRRYKLHRCQPDCGR